VAGPGRMRIRLYDVSGRLVRTLVDRAYAAGMNYVAVWDGRDDAGNSVPRGVYFVRMGAPSGATFNGRVVFLR
jgi:flagellar hook assembly protein FlgD